MKNLSNLPPKGTYDWYPEEFRIRKYIFDTWREVCESFGYEEYLTPIVENSEIYKAKSGEDVAGPELMTIKKEEGELAIRPEMTPSVTRMVTRFYDSKLKPIRLFSIANFMRFQKPQRGRNREFWQLNFDIFGSNSVNADIEILQVALEIMLSFKPPKGSFTVYINNRKLIEYILNSFSEVSSEKRLDVVRILDKFEKLPVDQVKARLLNVGITDKAAEQILKFMVSKTADELAEAIPEIVNNEGFKETLEIIERLKSLGYYEWIKFQPNVIRGFDYYDGMIFEVFDNNPTNNRSLFGGGRYNGLASIFGSKQFPAVGCAPGDEPIRLFLESWNLLNNIERKAKYLYYIPKLVEGSDSALGKLAEEIRSNGNLVISGLELQKLNKALEYSSKINANYTVIIGENELQGSKYILKDMTSGEQKEVAM